LEFSEDWIFQRSVGGEGVIDKTFPWGRFGYFLELHILFFDFISWIF